MARRPGRDIKAPFVTSGDPDSVNDTPVTSTTVGAAYDLSGQLGAILRSNDGTKEWIYAKFSSTSTGKTPAAGHICFWVANSTANLATPGDWVVDNQTSANTGVKASQAAGILRVAATRGNYVWLLRKAPSCIVLSTATGHITGNAVVATTASGEASFVSSTSTVAPAGGIGATPWFAAAPVIGWVNTTTTTPGNPGTSIDVALDIQ
jgi:hypothetical protein